ncbi:unnamed protein product [Ectocarpus sp. CCAP 1310/34]|nr:unnamed protein product [Ectocarpus sp. CCAP 1310/34]
MKACSGIACDCLGPGTFLAALIGKRRLCRTSYC